MKKILVLVVLFCAFCAYTATPYIIHRNHIYGPRHSTEENKRTGNIGETPEEKQKRTARREALIKSKSIKYSKVEIPEGAGSPVPIDRGARIESLCGFELGSVIKLSREPALDDDGNIEVVVKLKKPFRFCTHAKLKYSKVNHGLYSVVLYSAPREKMKDDEVLAEVEGMREAFMKKFEDRFGRWVTFDPVWPRIIGRDVKAVWYKSKQSLCIKAHEDVIDQSRTTLKGAAIKTKVRRGWTFSVELVDTILRDLEVEQPNRDKKGTEVEGVDVL